MPLSLRATSRSVAFLMLLSCSDSTTPVRDGGGADARADTDAGGSTDAQRRDTPVQTEGDASAPAADVAGRADAPITPGPIFPADALPPAGTWESAGVEGGIPVRETVCADVTQAPYNADRTGGSNASSAIQRALDACPTGQVVRVPAGTYRIGTTLQIRRSITLRGAGPTTIFQVNTGSAINIGNLGPWPPPKANADYYMTLSGAATRGNTTVNVANTSEIEIGKMIMIDETDDPDLVWTKNNSPGRYRASMHMVESKTATSVTFRPALPITYSRTPRLSRFPDMVRDAGIEHIKFVGVSGNPDQFIQIFSSWNVWVSDCEFTDMPDKTVVIGWSGHVELRRNYLHDQSNGGSNSEGLDLFADVNWSLVVDNACVAAGFPQINIGDGGANPFYSGGFGNVIAYNYCVDAYYTDPPTSTDAGKMPTDISTNHSPHSQYNLIEGNYMGKFGVDAYHGSGSHTVVFRNAITGASRWQHVSNRTAVQIDRRNLHYSIVGNVLGLSTGRVTMEYATRSGWSGSTIYRLGFPDIGNDGFSGTFPPTALAHSDGGPRDLFVERTTAAMGTTLIEGNWTSASEHQDWSGSAATIPDSLYLRAKPSWFGTLAWPPVDPASPRSGDPTIIPAGYRVIRGSEPPST